MRLILDIVLFIVIAVGLGIGSAHLAISNSDRIGLHEVGPWKTWPKASGPEADPYAQAQQARSGEMLLGPTEGLVFEASSDNAGTPLEGACQYRITGGHIPARLWTLSLVDEAGMLVDNPSRRYGFHSHEVVRRSGISFSIVTGPQVLGGNWLKSPENGPFRLLLRLYETSLSSNTDYSQVKLPDIEWVDCR